jgi:four helix bundle protein
METRGFRDLTVYQMAYASAMTIFRLSKSFPTSENYSLTSQVRRSSRSVCANLAEAYRKRRYPNHFISKLTDSDAECAETTVHLDFGMDCGYIDEKSHKTLIDEYAQIGKMLEGMMRDPGKFALKQQNVKAMSPRATAGQ